MAEYAILWHPESPGMKVIVKLKWWQCLFDTHFATLSQSLDYSYRQRPTIDRTR